MFPVTIYTPDNVVHHLLPAVPRRNDEIHIDLPTGSGIGTVDAVRWVLNPSTDEWKVRVWLRDWKAV